MAIRDEDTSVREVWGFLAELLKDETIPEPRRKRAAELLIGAGWIGMFEGTVDAAVKLLGPKTPVSTVTDLYDGSEMFEDRL